MLRAEDLMIGDWAYIYHPTRERTPVKVDGVWIETIERIDNGLTREDSPMFRIVEPIPLTPEILEKNGFKNTSVVTIGTRKMRWVSDDTRTEITIWMDDTLPMEIVKNVYYEDEVSYTLPFPATVHELQHTLRLCGIEKEIEL